MSTHKRMDELAERIPSFCEVRRINYLNTYDRRMRSLGAAFDRSSRRRLATQIARSRAGIVHVNKQNVEDGLDLLLAASDSGKPTVCTIHITRTMSELGAAGAKARDFIAKSALTKARCDYIAISTHCAKALQAWLGKTSRVHTVLNGVPDVAAIDRVEARRQLGSVGSDVLIGAVGRMETQKNPFFLLRLLRRLPGHYRLVWFGDGSLRNEFEAMTRSLDLRDRVITAGWRPNVRELLPALDVFAQPSLYEGLSLALLEAAAAALPIVTADVEGVGDVVEHDVNGLVIPVTDESAWVSGLLRLGDTDLRRRMGSSARQRYEEKFSLTSMAQSTESVYRRVITSIPATHRV